MENVTVTFKQLNFHCSYLGGAYPRCRVEEWPEFISMTIGFMLMNQDLVSYSPLTKLLCVHTWDGSMFYRQIEQSVTAPVYYFRKIDEPTVDVSNLYSVGY